MKAIEKTSTYFSSDVFTANTVVIAWSPWEPYNKTLGKEYLPSIAFPWKIARISIGPLQLAIHVVQNRRAWEQKSHWDKTNKENYHFKLYVFCLSCRSATFALQRGGFVPREWLAAKGLFV